MGKTYDHIKPDLGEWALKQSVLFIASAPLNGKHINVSPKGLPSTSFSIINPNLCAYVDATGSGIETVAHLLENGRATVMFCSFGPAPRILRFFCTGRVLESTEPGFDEWLKRMGEKYSPGHRAIIFLDVFKVTTSCGFAVPRLAIKDDPTDQNKRIAYFEDRQTLAHLSAKVEGTNKLNLFRAYFNARSHDGLLGLRSARRDKGERLWLGDLKAHVMRRSGPLYTILVILFSVVFTLISTYALGALQLPPSNKVLP